MTFEARFATQLSKLKLLDSISALPKFLSAYYLLAAANIGDNQHIEIMAAAHSSDADLTLHSSTGSFLKEVTYERVA